MEFPEFNWLLKLMLKNQTKIQIMETYAMQGDKLDFCATSHLKSGVKKKQLSKEIKRSKDLFKQLLNYKTDSDKLAYGIHKGIRKVITRAQALEIVNTNAQNHAQFLQPFRCTGTFEKIKLKYYNSEYNLTSKTDLKGRKRESIMHKCIDMAKVIMADIEKCEMKRVIDCEFEYFVEGEGQVVFSYWKTLGIMRPDICRSIQVASEAEMHLYISAENETKPRQIKPWTFKSGGIYETGRQHKDKAKVKPKYLFKWGQLRNSGSDLFEQIPINMSSTTESEGEDNQESAEIPTARSADSNKSLKEPASTTMKRTRTKFFNSEDLELPWEIPPEIEDLQTSRRKLGSFQEAYYRFCEENLRRDSPIQLQPKKISFKKADSSYPAKTQNLSPNAGANKWRRMTVMPNNMGFGSQKLLNGFNKVVSPQKSHTNLSAKHSDSSGTKQFCKNEDPVFCSQFKEMLVKGMKKERMQNYLRERLSHSKSVPQLEKHHQKTSIEFEADEEDEDASPNIGIRLSINTDQMFQSVDNEEKEKYGWKRLNDLVIPHKLKPNEKIIDNHYLISVDMDSADDSHLESAWQSARASQITSPKQKRIFPRTSTALSPTNSIAVQLQEYIKTSNARSMNVLRRYNQRRDEFKRKDKVVTSPTIQGNTAQPYNKQLYNTYNSYPICRKKRTSSAAVLGTIKSPCQKRPFSKKITS